MTGRIGLPVHCFKKYLLQLANHHNDFHLAEIESIISVLRCQGHVQENIGEKEYPFLMLNLPSEQDAKDIMSRSILGKNIYELWASGSSIEEIQTKINSLPPSFVNPFTSQDSSFRIRIECFNKKIQTQDKISKIERLLSGSLFKGKLNLTSPDHSFHLLELYNFDTKRTASKPDKIYFGRWICSGQRDKINEYSLQKRHFIANTSMDACLSMVMSNLGQVRKDDLVLDPFVGSGGLLVSSAHFGAYVIGTDIDYLLLHAKAKPSRAKQKERKSDESVRSNLKQYGLENQYLDVLVADASKHEMWRQDVRFDAIITDPPYGIREAAVKIVKKDVLDIEEVEAYIPQKSQYDLGDIFKDLLNFAAKYLRIGGRLVYWLPVMTQEYQESNVPSHPCFSQEYNCEQPLSSFISRRLITMKKVFEAENTSISSSQATIEVDHYAEQSFRDKYFKVEKPGNSEKIDDFKITDEHKDGL